MKKSKLLLLILISIILLSGCKKKQEENNIPNDQNIPVEPEVHPELPIDSTYQYGTNLDFYAAIAYDAGKCQGEYVNGNECTFTLNQLKKELPDYDLSSLDSYLGKPCDADIISVTIELDKVTSDNIYTTQTIDDKCMPIKDRRYETKPSN